MVKFHLKICEILKNKLNLEPKVDVEFFEPKMRPELQRRDAEVVKKTGRGPANGDEWTWITQYCRIPVRNFIKIQVFQNAIKSRLFMKPFSQPLNLLLFCFTFRTS